MATIYLCIITSIDIVVVITSIIVSVIIIITVTIINLVDAIRHANILYLQLEHAMYAC